MGCRVTSAANSGVCTSSKNEYFSLRARYSGSARPAWRISQTGGWSTGRQWQASRNRWRLLRSAAAADTEAAPARLEVEAAGLPEGARILICFRAHPGQGVAAGG